MTKHSPVPKSMPALDIRGPVGDPLRCPKRLFASERAARAEQNHMRPYFCALCDGWHLSSKGKVTARRQSRRTYECMRCKAHFGAARVEIFCAGCKAALTKGRPK